MLDFNVIAFFRAEQNGPKFLDPPPCGHVSRSVLDHGAGENSRG